MDTLTKSFSLTIVITANGEVQTHEEATMYVKELDIFLTMKVLENTPAVLSLGKLCDENGYSYEWINGRKPHLIKKTGFGYNAARRTSFLFWFQACQRVLPPVLILQLQWHLQDRRGIVLYLLQARLLLQRQQHQVIVRLEKGSKRKWYFSSACVQFQCWWENGDTCCLPWIQSRARSPSQPKTSKKPNKKESQTEREDPLYSEIPEWLQEFRENLVDDEIPLQGGSHASSSHEPSLEPTTKRREDLGKHSVYTHFSKDRNCEICKRTKITRAPCRRRNGEAVPRAVNFGDLTTAQITKFSVKIVNLETHRYAIVVQDLASQWIQSYPCKTNTSQERQRSLQKFLEPVRKPEVIYTDKLVKTFPGIIARLHHTDQKQMGLLKEQCAE